MKIWTIDPIRLCDAGKRLMNDVVEHAGSPFVDKTPHGINVHQRDANCPWLARLIEHTAKCKKCSQGLKTDNFRASKIMKQRNP